MEKWKFSWLITGLLFALLLLPQPAAAAGDLVVSEIGASAASDREWIEIYNRSGAAVDLTGWKFWEDGTNHGLTAFQGDLIIDPGEYAIIADVAQNFKDDHTPFAGTIIDSSWTTLNESGEEIGLKDASGGFVEKFSYISAPTHSLERADLALDDYTAANWKEHASGDTAGAANSAAEMPPAPPAPAPSGGGGGGSAPITPTPIAGEVRINEFVADPTDGEEEWVELWNGGGSAVDLSAWTLEDGTGTKTTLAGIIAPQGFFLIQKPKGNLNNSGDRIVLRDAGRVEVDALSYGIWNDGTTADNAPAGQDPASIARKTDGSDSGNDAADFAVTQLPTPGAPNLISVPTTNALTLNPQSPISNIQSPILSPVRISEIFPNPRGDDIREFIELENTSEAAVDLKDAELTVGSARYRIGSRGEATRVDAKHYFVAPRSITALILPNDTATVSVQHKDWRDELKYRAPVPEEGSFIRTSSTTQWTLAVTPGAANAIRALNRAPVSALEATDEAENGMLVLFDASDSYDPDNDALQYRWHFGDKSPPKGYGPELRIVAHEFARPGKYTVELLVRDGREIARATHRITILPKVASADAPRTVRFSELAVNPKGADTSEWIEFENFGEAKVELSGWMIEDTIAGKTSDPVPSLTIPAKGFAVVKMRALRLTLANTEGAFSLLDPLGEEIDVVEYGEAPDNATLSRDKGGAWQWSRAATPGKANAIVRVAAGGVATGGGGSLRVRYAGRVDLDELRELDLGARVETEGVVSALPGSLGSQIFYLGGSSGIQAFQSRKDFPKLALGDRILVRGELSEAGGERRIKARGRGDILVQGSGEAPEAHEITSKDMGEGTEGTLVRLKGEVVEAKQGYFVIADDDGEARVTIKSTTGIDSRPVREGDLVALTGIVSETKSGFRILPRFKEDIIITGHEDPVAAAPSTGNLRSERTDKYMVGTATGLGGMLATILWQSRRQLLSAAVRLALRRKGGPPLPPSAVV